MEMETQKREPSTTRSLEGSVCVIDGDEGIRNSLYMLLGTLGVHVVTFPSAEDFLKQLDDQYPAFLITEISLPGMGGFDLKRILNEKGLQVPSIGLTGESDPREKDTASRLGFLDLVEKPFVYWSVVDRVQRAVQAA
mgnify:CR=1 FL=1